MPLFATVYHALNTFIACNPARARYFNLQEPEGGCKPDFAQFSGEHPHDVWAAICWAIKKVLKDCTRQEQIAFKLYFLKMAPEDQGRAEIAKTVGISENVFRWQKKKLEEYLIRRRLIAPPLSEMH
jgi:hypothetical protein